MATAQETVTKDPIVAFAAALQNLTFTQMMEIAEDLCAALPNHKGPVVAPMAMAMALSDLQEEFA